VSRRRRRHDLRARVADDDADLVDAGLGHLLDPVEQDRLVRHRDQLLGAGVRDRAEPGAGAAREDEALHGVIGFEAMSRNCLPRIRHAGET